MRPVPGGEEGRQGGGRGEAENGGSVNGTFMPPMLVVCRRTAAPRARPGERRLCRIFRVEPRPGPPVPTVNDRVRLPPRREPACLAGAVIASGRPAGDFLSLLRLLMATPPWESIHAPVRRPPKPWSGRPETGRAGRAWLY